MPNSSKQSKIADWSKKNTPALLFLNISVMVLVLLRSNNYFQPFFLITTNIITLFISIVMLTVLRIRPTVFFILSLVFLMFSFIFFSLKLGLWADRAGVYCFEYLGFGLLALYVKQPKYD